MPFSLGRIRSVTTHHKDATVTASSVRYRHNSAIAKLKWTFLSDKRWNEHTTGWNSQTTFYGLKRSMRRVVEAASISFSYWLSGTPKVCFNTLPVSTTHVLDFERRPASMARPSQVAVLVRRQSRVRSFLSFAGQLFVKSSSNVRPRRASPANAMPWAQTNSLR